MYIYGLHTNLFASRAFVDIESDQLKGIFFIELAKMRCVKTLHTLHVFPYNYTKTHKPRSSFKMSLTRSKSTGWIKHELKSINGILNFNTGRTSVLCERNKILSRPFPLQNTTSKYSYFSVLILSRLESTIMKRQNQACIIIVPYCRHGSKIQFHITNNARLYFQSLKIKAKCETLKICAPYHKQRFPFFLSWISIIWLSIKKWNTFWRKEHVIGRSINLQS